jgi:hypothetical protein
MTRKSNMPAGARHLHAHSALGMAGEFRKRRKETKKALHTLPRYEATCLHSIPL